MRLTVGPLPPAVYWRRRAVVLGALLLAVFLLVSYCGGGGKSGAADPNRTGNTVSPAPSASAEVLTPVVGGPAPASASVAPPVSGQPQPTGPCADDEIAVIVSTEGRTDAFVGDPVRMLLKIKNVSGRSCVRDIGATQQELRLTQGAQKAWSSDDCNGATGSMMRTLRPGEEVLTADMTWNGRASTNCQLRPLPAPGTYQLFGRMGTRHSEPVTLTLKPKK